MLAAENAAAELPGAADEWTPEQQIAHMLELCEAQIESALSEADAAIDTLVASFTSMAETVRALRAQADSPPSGAAGAQLCEQLDAVTAQINAAVVAFQFYDKLTQRLGHVRYSLSTLALFVCNRAQTNERDQWRKLFKTLQRLYRTQEEREIFELMIEGASAQEARKRAEHSGPGSSAGTVELF